MKYPKLRIAWSVLCGVLCLLLVALWVRSYWHADAEPKMWRAYVHPSFGWDGTDYPDYFMVYLPHWLPALGLAAVAIIPCVPWYKRFSLRTLLIATTLVAVGLRLAVYVARD